MAERAVLAALLAIVPLLPSGPGYVGLAWPNAVDGAVLVLAGSWLIARRKGRRPVPDRPDAMVVYSWALFVVVATGAMVTGLAYENRLGSPVLAALTPEFFPRMLAPAGLTSDPFISARVWLTVVEGFVTFVIVRDCCLRAADSAQVVRVASWGWLAGTAVISLFAIAQYVTKFRLHPVWVRANPDLVRAHATLDDPNILGSYLLLSLGLVIGLVLSERRPMLIRLVVGLGVLTCVALVTTASRGAWAGLLLTTLILISVIPVRFTTAAHLGSLQRIARWALGGLVVLLIGLVLARLVVTQRPLAADPPRSPVEVVTHTIDPRVPLREVFKDRLEYWTAALRMGAHSPETGLGLGLYPRRLPDFRSVWVPPENTHNFFLQMLAETGLPGLIALVAVLGLSTALLFAIVRTGQPPRAGLALGGLFGNIAFAFTLLTSHALLMPSAQILWASALALALAGSMSHDAPAATLTKWRTAAPIAGAFVVSLYLLATLRMLPPPRPGPWGYSFGFFEEEGGFFPASFALAPDDENPGVPFPPGTQWARFRWTGTRSILELQTPRGATECVIPFAASSPSHGSDQFVRIFYGETPLVMRIQNSDLNTVRIPLTARTLDTERRLVVRIQVAPSFVPAALGLSDDRRQLGVLMFRPRCS